MAHLRRARNGRWYVASDRDLDDLGLYSNVGLWNFGPVVVHATPHFLALSHPADGNRLDAPAAIGAQAMNDLHARWPLAWSERIPMVLPGSVAELAAIIQSTVDLDKFVAFTAYSDTRDTGYANTAARIYIQDKALSQFGHDFQLDTLVHELDHAAVATFGGPAIPSWVHEGVADWVGTGTSLTEHKPRGSDGSCRAITSSWPARRRRSRWRTTRAGRRCRTWPGAVAPPLRPVSSRRWAR